MDGFNTLGQEKIGWIITSLFPGQKLTGWQFLRLPLEYEHYRGTMTSILLNTEEQDLLPSLFAMGMVSFHMRPLTYNSFKAEVDKFHATLKKVPHVPMAVAIGLRDKLTELQKIDDLERLEKGLYKWVDGSVQQQMRLIKAQLQVGNNLEALLGMKHVLASNPGLKAEIIELGKKYLGIEDISDYKAKLNIHHALVVDPDESQLKFLRECLTELGVAEIKTCDDATYACEYLKSNSTVDLVIGEWKQHGMDGGAFIQHVRHHGYTDKPILIFSSLVDDAAEELMNEVGGVFVMLKPCTKKIFQQQLVDQFNRWRYPLAAEDLEQKIRISLNNGDVDYARQLMVQFENNPKVEATRKKFMKACFAYQAGQYREAKTMILENAKVNMPSHKEVGLLGKILLKLGEFNDAQKCLEQANVMVPGNIERLCDLADVAAEVGAEEEIMKYMDEAREIGGDTGMVMAAYARHATALGQADDARRYMVDEEVARNVVAYMNNLGVAYANSGKFKESVDSYVKAIKTLGEMHVELQGTVYYNLGLSLVRQGRYKEALPALKNAQKKADDTVAKKSTHLLERVQHAIDNNVPVMLRETAKVINPQVTKIPSIHPMDQYMEMQAAHVKPGEHALFLIFQPTTQPELDLQTEFPKIIRKSA
ncbi:response regulator [Oligoflexus tunisiensis]|uniref:response regulator n=1 Tax=Oligoflexus tunisiensis TaxID=708132 RepID=UPI001C4040CC|nr:tetratricopeptide repeat protein [Oligoflexus tunisiensis]